MQDNVNATKVQPKCNSILKSKCTQTMENLSKEVDFPKSFGWIGLGAMGFPMALQLRQKVPPDSTLYIYDVDNGAMERFVEAARNIKAVANIQIMSNAREVAEESVRPLYVYHFL